MVQSEKSKLREEGWELIENVPLTDCPGPYFKKYSDDDTVRSRYQSRFPHCDILVTNAYQTGESREPTPHMRGVWKRKKRG